MTRIGLAGLACLVAVGLVTGGGKAARQGRPVIETLDALALSLGFGIGQVEITGHSFTSDASIHETLDLANAGSLLRLDSAAVRQRIERLPWIETAAVTRVFPDRLRIAITERQPVARWQRGERMFLIDRTGRVLTPIQVGAVPHLPLVTGEGAAGEVDGLLSLLQRHPALGERLEAADRVDGRRWTLRLEGGPALQLPATGEAEALGRLAAAGGMQAIAAMPAGTVDVRVPGRMIVRRDGTQAPPAPASRPAERQGKSATPGIGKEKQGAQRG